MKKVWNDAVRELKGGGERLTRSVFLYMEPEAGDDEADDFAQCDCCRNWTGDDGNRCLIIGPETEVTEDMSCGLFVRGDPQPDEEPLALVSSEEAGLVNRSVRCENCSSFDGRSTCMLFATLNREMPDRFDLDASVNKLGCCNAQTPR